MKISQLKESLNNKDIKIIKISVNGQNIRTFFKPYKTFRNAEKFGYNWARSQNLKLFKVDVFSV